MRTVFRQTWIGSCSHCYWRLEEEIANKPEKRASKTTNPVPVLTTTPNALTLIVIMKFNVLCTRKYYTLLHYADVRVWIRFSYNLT